MTTNTVSQVTIATQKVTAEAEYTALINGFGTDLVGVDPLVLIGTTYPRAALLAKFQSRIDAAQATRSARANLRTVAANERALAERIEPVRQAMKHYLQGRFGKNSPMLQAFGFTEAKTVRKTAESKAGAVVKMMATRKARHTMGKKQRLAITAPTVDATSTQVASLAPKAASTSDPGGVAP
jgi:hypothetical protein